MGRLPLKLKPMDRGPAKRGDTCRGWCDGRERPALINKNVDVTMLYLFPGPVPGGLFFASMVVLD